MSRVSGKTKRRGSRLLYGGGGSMTVFSGSFRIDGYEFISSFLRYDRYDLEVFCFSPLRMIM